MVKKIFSAIDYKSILCYNKFVSLTKSERGLKMPKINDEICAKNDLLFKMIFGDPKNKDIVQQQITVNNPLDEMSDEEILKAVENRPNG
jgi:hypothetical protein